MIKRLIYVVTKSSDDGTFRVGDRIWMMDDGSIGCQQAQGWVNPGDVDAARMGMECEIDAAWVARRNAKLLAELDALNG